MNCTRKRTGRIEYTRHQVSNCCGAAPEKPYVKCEQMLNFMIVFNRQLRQWMLLGFACGTFSYLLAIFYGPAFLALPPLGYYPIGSTFSRLLWSLHKLGWLRGM